MERLSGLQQRLLSSESSQVFDHSQFVEWVVKFHRLFSIDEEMVVSKFTGTPAQLRAVLDELLVLAEKCKVNMEKAVWGKYPNICPYCLTKPCSCNPQKIEPHKHLNVLLPRKGLTLGNIQMMLREIYPRQNSLLQQDSHLVEEVAEASLEIFHSGDPEKVEEEFADIFARFLQIANTLGISLEGFVP